MNIELIKTVVENITIALILFNLFVWEYLGLKKELNKFLGTWLNN